MELHDPYGLKAGKLTRLVVDNVPPGERVIFFYGTRGGGHQIPGCSLHDNALQIEKPKFLGRGSPTPTAPRFSRQRSMHPLQ
jgi:hypothetical protein